MGDGAGDSRSGLHARELAEEALRHFAALDEIERLGREQTLNADGRRQLRQQRAKPFAETLRQWLTRQLSQVPDGSATATVIKYSLGRWAALVRYIDDGDLPIDNNHIENQTRPVALGRGTPTYPARQPNRGTVAAPLEAAIDLLSTCVARTVTAFQLMVQVRRG